MKYIVINGNPRDGFTFHGEFDSLEKACDWGDKNFDETGFTVGKLREAIT